MSTDGATTRRRARAAAAASSEEPHAPATAEDERTDYPPPDAQGPWVVEWALETVHAFAVQACMALLSWAPVQWLWRLSVVQYAYAVINITSAVFFQKLGMLHLHEVDCVGGPAHGLTAIVTGPTSGIGTETAAALARRGAKVVLACRDVARGEQLKALISEQCQKRGYGSPELEVWQLDLASLKSVREFGAKWEQQQRTLHILINNAGIFSMGAPRAETEDGFESHIGSNHLGHFLLTLMLVPSLQRGAAEKPSFGARIVHVSSMNHTMAPLGMNTSDPHFRLPKSYDTALAYAQSKLAQILFCKEMRRRMGPESPIQVFAVHPGMVLTNVARTLPAFIQWGYQKAMGLLLLTPSEGSRASVWAATSPEAPLEGWKTMGYIDANCKPISTSLAGLDMTQALWVWRWSAEQVQLPPQLNLPEP